MRRTLRLAVGSTFVGLALILAGCSIDYGTSNTTPTTVSADQVAEAAEDALEEEMGSRPEIDCGSEAVDLDNGSSRTCTLTDPETGAQYDAEVELTDVAGTDYRVEVDVATEPNS